MTRAKNLIGLSGVNEEQIFKAMQGRSGQRLIEDSMETFLSDPKSYNLYTQFVRELQKVGSDAESVSEEDFAAAMGALVGDIVSLKESNDALESLNKTPDTQSPPQPTAPQNLSDKIAESILKRTQQ